MSSVLENDINWRTYDTMRREGFFKDWNGLTWVCFGGGNFLGFSDDKNKLLENNVNSGLDLLIFQPGAEIETGYISGPRLMRDKKPVK